ncbi:Fmp16p SCDLUD_001619 [Saccharomycodes ludwigii]|uniref:Fmp16p n=1 Tax=Saccharomycodes ludwigii TaxID=36035 RepID=UPI001E8502E8|nr:hypothetical protein SCDLUD_001619 [Saccharomycodes ludwigii]KAH3901836.1 hypothetical protein SCDLUD_001619 [Saccharomycodes ludwigii]
MIRQTIQQTKLLTFRQVTPTLYTCSRFQAVKRGVSGTTKVRSPSPNVSESKFTSKDTFSSKRNLTKNEFNMGETTDQVEIDENEHFEQLNDETNAKRPNIDVLKKRGKTGELEQERPDDGL